MLPKTIVFLLLIFTFSGQSAFPDDKIHLPDLIKTAVESNTDIQSAKAQWTQTIERYPQATSLDDPILNFSYYIENVETRRAPRARPQRGQPLIKPPNIIQSETARIGAKPGAGRQGQCIFSP